MSRTMREEIAEFKRASVLKEATRQFYEKGYDGTRIEEIGATLGVTKPFIYYLFKNKTELLDEICVEATAVSVETLQAAIAAHSSTLDQLRHAVRQLVLQVIATQMGIAICFREEKYISSEARLRLEANRRRFDVLMNELLSRANKEGVIAIRDPQVAAQVLTGAITWSFVWFRQGGRLSAEECADQIVELAMSMLNAKPF
jgi:AcrR family transcriptional regulator